MLYHAIDPYWSRRRFPFFIAQHLLSVQIPLGLITTVFVAFVWYRVRDLGLIKTAKKQYVIVTVFCTLICFEELFTAGLRARYARTPAVNKLSGAAKAITQLIIACIFLFNGLCTYSVSNITELR